MTVAKLKKLSLRNLKALAYEYNLRTAGDFKKEDYVDAFIELLGDDKVAWKLMDQYMAQ